jgi:hypothetical protein
VLFNKVVNINPIGGITKDMVCVLPMAAVLIANKDKYKENSFMKL